MASGKQTSTVWTVIIIVISIIGLSSRVYKAKKNKDYRQAQERRQIYEMAKAERQRAEIQDKIYIPDAESNGTDAAETAPIVTDKPSTSEVVPEKFKQLSQSNKDVPQVLSPFLKFIGHVHLGRRYVVGPTPAVSLDGKRFGMFDSASRYGKSVPVRFVVSDIEYVDDENIHRNSGLDVDETLSLHKRQIVDLGTTEIKNILNLTALDNGNWFWLKGNLYQKSKYSGNQKKEPATCWFTWSGKDGDEPNKVCLDSSQEYGDLHSVQISINGSVGLFAQKKKTKDVEGQYNSTVPFLTNRLIAVDLVTGQLMAESPINPSTKKDVELSAFFLDPKGTRVVISESVRPEPRTLGSVSFYNWDVVENKIIGQTQTIKVKQIKIGPNYPTKIDALFSARDGQTISLMYEKGAGQVTLDTKSGVIKAHNESSNYAFSAGERASPEAWSGFPLANGNVLFVVKDRHGNVSWQVFNQMNGEILGQKSKMHRGLQLSYPMGEIAMTTFADRFNVYEVQK